MTTTRRPTREAAARALRLAALRQTEGMASSSKELLIVAERALARMHETDPDARWIQFEVLERIELALASVNRVLESLSPSFYRKEDLENGGGKKE